VAKTFAQIKALALAKADKTADELELDVGDLVNEYILELGRTSTARCFQRATTFALGAGESSKALPADWSREVSLYYVDDAGFKIDLEPLDKETFDERYPPGTQTSDPAAFSVWGSTIYFGPGSTGGRMIYARYYGYLDELSVGVTTNAILAVGWDVVLAGTIAKIFEATFEEQRASFWHALAARKEARLSGETRMADASARPSQAIEPG